MKDSSRHPVKPPMSTLNLCYLRQGRVLRRDPLARLPDTHVEFFAQTRDWRLKGLDGLGPQSGDYLSIIDAQDALHLKFTYVFGVYGWVLADSDSAGCQFKVVIEREGQRPHHEWVRTASAEETMDFAAHFVEELAPLLAGRRARVSMEDHATGARTWIAGPNGTPLGDFTIDAETTMVMGQTAPLTVAWKAPARAEVTAVDLVVLAPGARVTPASVRIELPHPTAGRSLDSFRQTFKLHPLREGSIQVVAEVMIQGDPILRCEHTLHVLCAVSPWT